MYRRSLLSLGLLVVGFASSLGAEEPEKHQFVGLVQPLAMVELRPRVSSVVTKINFTAGQNVRKGDLLVEIDPTRFEAALAVVQAELDVAQADLARATAGSQRAQQLSAKGAISREAIEQAAADRDRAAAEVNVAKAKLDVARIDLMFTKVVAPIDGVIGPPLQSPGDTVVADTTDLGVLVSTDPQAVYFNVSQETVLDMRDAPNPEASVWLPRSKEPVRGRIEWAANALDTKTGTLQMRVLVPNPSGKLLPGMAVTVECTANSAPRKHDE
jgi:RND family efflux transporter MFP subunit